MQYVTKPINEHNSSSFFGFGAFEIALNFGLTGYSLAISGIHIYLGIGSYFPFGNPVKTALKF